MTFATEALACYRAIQLGIDEGWAEVIIEGDALSVIKKSKSQVVDKSLIGAHIQNIQHLKNSFQGIFFQHIPRSANRLAHVLATRTLKDSEEVYLIDCIPGFVMHLLIEDRERKPD